MNVNRILCTIITYKISLWSQLVFWKTTLVLYHKPDMIKTWIGCFRYILVLIHNLVSILHRTNGKQDMVIKYIAWPTLMYISNYICDFQGRILQTKVEH